MRSILENALTLIVVASLSLMAFLLLIVFAVILSVFAKKISKRAHEKLAKVGATKPIRSRLHASSVTIGALVLLVLMVCLFFSPYISVALDSFLSLLGLSFWQAFWIMIIPVIIDLPRVIGKDVILLLHWLYSRFFTPKIADVDYPSVSIIVAAHNEEKTIERCIETLVEAYYPGKKEIIVIDDGSTDRTYHKASRYEDHIKLVRREHCSGTRASAMSTGLPFSTGDVIIPFDADTFMERKSLVNIIKPLSDPDVGAVSGNVRVFNRSNLLTKMQAYEYMMAMEMGRRYQSIVRTLLIVPGAFGAIRQGILKGLGGYDIDTMSEDFDLTLKVHKTRKKVKFASEALAYTVVPDTLRSWIGQRIRWARGEIQSLKKHRNMLFRPFFKAPGMIGTPDMIFIDIVSLFARNIWAIYLAVFYWQMLLKILLLVVAFYALIETISSFSALVLSANRSDLKYVFYIPLMVMIYRPLHDVVRQKAYIDEILGVEAEW